MLYNKSRINEAVEIYEKISEAQLKKKMYVIIPNIDFDDNIKSLKNLGYKVTNCSEGVKIEWKEY